MCAPDEEGGREEGKMRRTRGMSVGLSAALARSAAPGSVESSAIWSGRGTEGMRLCLPASLGMVVPSLAMSKRSPPSWGSDGGAILEAAVWGVGWLIEEI